MRKVLTIILIFCIILIGLCQIVLPKIAENTISTELKTALDTGNVNVRIGTMPGFMLLVGQLDNIYVEAENGKLGQIRCQRLVLKGENVKADLSALDVRDGSAIESADVLNLKGTITEENLQEFLQKKLDKVDELSVSITKDTISAKGKVKLLGQIADISLEGSIYEQNGMIFFRMKNLDIKNARFGSAVLGNFFGDVEILNLQGISFPAEFDGAEQKDGYVVLSASRRK